MRREARGIDNRPIKRRPPIVKNPMRPRPTLHAIQEWEGYVVDIRRAEFVARLADVTAGQRYETLEATVPIKDLSEHDAARMEMGSFFRWVIGYERLPDGTRKLVSRVVLRDPPRITLADLREAEAWAHETAAVFEPAHAAGAD